MKEREKKERQTKTDRVKDRKSQELLNRTSLSAELGPKTTE